MQRQEILLLWFLDKTALSASVTGEHLTTEPTMLACVYDQKLKYYICHFNFTYYPLTIIE